MTLRQLSFQNLSIAALSFCTFCIIELVIGFRSSSLALIADAFQISYNLIEVIFALITFIKIQELERHGLRTLSSLGSFTFGWDRIEILGAFSNGVFLLALSISIALQTIKRFIDPHSLTNPMDIIIVRPFRFMNVAPYSLTRGLLQ
ncbi:cation efflux family-domain-containing protein [Melampsora americana]|nr:cation efflux family-domain-containing protein [Melampsora americana]